MFQYIRRPSMFSCGTVNLFPLSYACKFEDVFQLMQKWNIFQFINKQYVSKFKCVFVFLLMALKKDVYIYMINRLHMPRMGPLPILWGKHDAYVYTYMHYEENYIFHWIGIWKTQNILRSLEIAVNSMHAITMKTSSRIYITLLHYIGFDTLATDGCIRFFKNFASNDNLLQHIMRIYPGVDGTNIQLT